MPSQKEKLIAAAQKLVEKGQFDKAVKEYAKVVAEDPHDLRTWLKIGDLNVKLGHGKDAADAYLHVAQFYSDQGFYLKAVAVYKQIVKLNPGQVDIHQRLADLYRQLGLVSDAMVHYGKVSETLLLAGKTRDALPALKNLVELEPDNISSRIKLAELYSKEQMSREAVAEFTRAAELLKDSGRTDDYLKVAERALFLAPEMHALARELARIYLQKKDPRRALPKLQVAFKADPRDLDTLALLAAAFEALRQIPKSLSVLKELARIQRENGDKDRSEATYRKILRLTPDDADAQAALAALKPAAASQVAPARPAASVEAARAAPSREVPPARESFSPSRRGVATAFADAMGDDRAEAAQDLASAVAQQAERRSYAVDSLAGAPETVTLSAEPASTDEVPEEPTGPARIDEMISRILTETDVYRKYGLHAKAFEHLQRVFEIDPDHIEAHERYSSLLAHLGRHEEAVAELWGLYQQGGATERGVGYLREILRIFPGQPDALGLIAEAEAAGLGHGSPMHDPTLDALGDAVSADGLEVVDMGDDAVMDDPSYSELSIHADASAYEAAAALAGSDGDPAGRDGEYPLEGFGGATAENQPRGFSSTRHARDPGTDTAQRAVSSRVTSEYSADQMEPGARGERGAGRLPSDSERASRSPVADPTLPPPGAGVALEDALDEADYYSNRGMLVEAHSILQGLLESFPQHPLILAKLQDVESLAASRRVDVSQGEFQSEDTSLGTPAGFSAPDPAAFEPPPPSRFDSPTAGIVDPTGDSHNFAERSIHPEDFETHYDLGIAYKEMGLLDDAVAEFQIVMQDPEREVLCHTMIGLCYLEQSRVVDAISQFKHGLYAEGIQEREELALYYELGHAYERLDDAREALYYYEKVVKRDARFRDVADRIAALRERVGDLVPSRGDSGVSEVPEPDAVHLVRAK